MSNLEAIINELDKTTAPERESDFFKFPIGDTRIRILTDFTRVYSLYEGEYPNSKYIKTLVQYTEPGKNQKLKMSAWAWAIVRGKPDTIKIVQLPYSLMKAFIALTKNADWSFNGFPMKHDLTISNTGEGGARYSLQGSPRTSETPKEIMDALKTKKSCDEIVATIINKQEGRKAEPMKSAFDKDTYPKDDIDPADIPF